MAFGPYVSAAKMSTALAAAGLITHLITASLAVGRGLLGPAASFQRCDRRSVTRAVRWRPPASVRLPPPTNDRRLTTTERHPIPLTGAGAAQHSAFAPDFPPEVDALAALIAYRALAFVAGELLRRKLHPHRLHLEQVLVRDLAISQHLLLVLVGNLGMNAARQLF